MTTEYEPKLLVGGTLRDIREFSDLCKYRKLTDLPDILMDEFGMSSMDDNTFFGYEMPLSCTGEEYREFSGKLTTLAKKFQSITDVDAIMKAGIFSY